MNAAANISDSEVRIRALASGLFGDSVDGWPVMVEEFLDHGELGEALRELAWVIVSDQRPIPMNAFVEIEALAARMNYLHEMPLGKTHYRIID